MKVLDFVFIWTFGQVQVPNGIVSSLLPVLTTTFQYWQPLRTVQCHIVNRPFIDHGGSPILVINWADKSHSCQRKSHRLMERILAYLINTASHSRHSLSLSLCLSNWINFMLEHFISSRLPALNSINFGIVFFCIF